jgi:hypothetical protein
MSRIVGECCSSHASATCRGDAPRRDATASSTADCNGVNPPSGKYGVYAIPSRAHRDVRDAGLHRFAEHGDRLAAIARRPPDARTGELHGAIAHAAQREIVGKFLKKIGSTSTKSFVK